MEQLMELWNTYYPQVLTIGGVIITFATGAFAIYQMVKPLLDKVSDLKKTITDKSSEVSPLALLDMETRMTDLKAKLDNPTISDELKLQYQDQYYRLEKMYSSASSLIEKGEDIVGKF